MGAALDVLVVGGGPAGTAFVLALAQRAPALAARTLVLEKDEHPREKYCGGAISAFGIEELAALGYTLDVPHVSIDAFRARFGERSAEHERAGMGVVIRRDELDASLWRKAAETAATLRDGEAVTSVRRDGDGWQVGTSAGQVYRARVLIAADGAGSRVRKLLHLGEPRKRCRLYVLETPPVDDLERRSNTLEFDLSVVDEGVQGYYWDFPILLNGVRSMSRGIYHMNQVPRRDLKEVLKRALARRGIDPETVHYKPYSERGYVHGAPISYPGLLLVGEAAGIDVVTGEGIAHAIVYARVAAAVVARAFETRAFHFESYGALLRSTLMARHLRQSAFLAPHVYGRNSARWAAFLAQRPNVVAACAKWYEGRAVGPAEFARIGGQLAGELWRRQLAPRAAP